MRKHHQYRKAFIKAYGDGPWPCFGCGKEVSGWVELRVHHIDLNPENDAPENMAAMHHGCHNTLHHKGSKRSPETIERMRQAALRRYQDPEQRRRASEIQQRRTGDAAFSEKMSKAAKRTYEDPNRRAANAEHLRKVSSTDEERKRRSDRAKRMWAEGKLGRKNYG